MRSVAVLALFSSAPQRVAEHLSTQLIGRALKPSHLQRMELDDTAFAKTLELDNATLTRLGIPSFLVDLGDKLRLARKRKLGDLGDRYSQLIRGNLTFAEFGWRSIVDALFGNRSVPVPAQAPSPSVPPGDDEEMKRQLFTQQLGTLQDVYSDGTRVYKSHDGYNYVRPGDFNYGRGKLYDGPVPPKFPPEGWHQINWSDGKLVWWPPDDPRVVWRILEDGTNVHIYPDQSEEHFLPDGTRVEVESLWNRVLMPFHEQINRLERIINMTEQ
eukprot:gnl/TRDRNA2_/TRDRNA2_195370_c0_seq1.p1 gnl/TRDRNA2_/TRDRNA2_195370_c0~~gnl/TRDRNA2_/TRDRNA2_195370_c0_seq1.p1  ORF type:complete len:271 (-),score=35.11 gnl/TRDRNA2_/TRDRNA2_195370_c0_seq1:89-901(-)